MKLQMLLDLKVKQSRGLHMPLTVDVATEEDTTAASLKVVRKEKEKREISRVLHPVAGDVGASEEEEDQEGSTVDASSEVAVGVADEVARIMDMMMAAMKEKWKLKAP